MIKLVIVINTPGAAGLLDLMTHAATRSLGEAYRKGLRDFLKESSSLPSTCFLKR
jgi:hypothetical protein